MAEPERIEVDAADIEEIVDDRRGSVISVRVGDRLYPARHIAQCKLCRSQYRLEIERGIINGLTYNTIIEVSVDPYDDHSPLGPPTYSSILNHVRKRHMPVPWSMQRQMIEDRAAEMGKSVQEGEQLLVDSVAVHRAVIQRGFERMNSGEIQPTMGDLMKALQLQAAVEGDAEDDGVDEEVWRDALIAYMEIVQRHVTPAALEMIKRDMATSPTLRAIAARRQQTIAGEVE